jgi:hypothetical protein
VARLDRYLKDVRAYLPGDQADDIIQELSENLQAEFDDREERLGRPLSEHEQQAILDAHGNPLAVAAQYRPERQSLAFGREWIGPALFPAYVRVLAINIGITLVVALLAAAAVASGVAADPVLGSIPLAILIQFGAVTAIFAIADGQASGERGRSRLPTQAAAKITSIEPSPAAGPGASHLDRLAEQLIGSYHPRSVPRRTSASDFALFAVAIGWVVAVRPPVVVDILRSGPGWESFFLPILGLFAVGALVAIATFVRPEWALVRLVGRLLVDLGVLVVFVLSLGTGSWVALANPTTATASQSTLVTEVNRWVGFSLLVASAIVVLMVLLSVRRLVVARRAFAPRGQLGRTA